MAIVNVLLILVIVLRLILLQRQYKQNNDEVPIPAINFFSLQLTSLCLWF